MLFTQIEFYIFFTFLLILLFLARNNPLKKSILLAANIYFYALWDVWFLLLLFASTLITFFAGLKIENNSIRVSKIALVIGISVNISILLYFKYLNFFIDSLKATFGVEIGQNDVLNLILPLGISFYSFRFVGYLIDIYRRQINPYENIIDFLIYGTFFPIIVSGPIARAGNFLSQLSLFKVEKETLYEGFKLFVFGLFLKVFIADRIAMYVNYFYDNYAIFNTATSWLAVIGYTFQIYCDFAGYSNMAIGSALMMGIRIEKNFDFPYLANSMSEFWRKWHITLSTWIRDYLYIPLGGNRRGELRKHINLLITMTICGLWHGASWTFVVWGFLHGVALVINHKWSECVFSKNQKPIPVLYTIFSWLLTFMTVTIFWIYFRSSNFSQAVTILQKMFSFETEGVAWYHPFVIFMILSITIFHLVQRVYPQLYFFINRSKFSLTITFCLIWLVVVFFQENFKPFIYSQF